MNERMNEHSHHMHLNIMWKGNIVIGHSAQGEDYGMEISVQGVC